MGKEREGEGGREQTREASMTHRFLDATYADATNMISNIYCPKNIFLFGSNCFIKGDRTIKENLEKKTGLKVFFGLCPVFVTLHIYFIHIIQVQNVI